MHPTGVSDDWDDDDDAEDEILWDIIDSGTTPWRGYWFLVELSGIHKYASGELWTWITPEEDINVAEEQSDYEEPQFLYVELDPEQDKSHGSLFTIFNPMGRRAWDARHKAIKLMEDEGRDVGYMDTGHFYEGTANVLAARGVTKGRAEEAVKITIDNLMNKWKRAPYRSGRKQKIPLSARFEQSPDFAKRLFEVDPGFYGVDP